MQKRNFILLVIVLAITSIIILGVLYSRSNVIPEDGTQGTNFISRFNPFGSNKTPPSQNTNPPVDISESTPSNDTETKEVKLKKISSVPIAGYGLSTLERLKEIPVPTPETLTTSGTITKTTKPTPPPTEFMLAVRYVERATGHIFQTFLDKIEERKYSTTTIPKIYEAYFGNKDKSVFMRYLNGDGRTIETFLGIVPKEVLGGDTSNNEITGAFLPDDITDMSISPDNTKMFYLLNVGDNVVGTVLNLADNKKTQVFSSPFTEWLSFWPNVNTITLTTKPSFNVPGHLYSINPNTKTFNRVLSDIVGLTTLTSPNGKLILYGDSSLALYTYNISTKTSTLLGVRTLPEKCVWGSTSETIYCAVPRFIETYQLPDAWYQGEISFSDQIWKISIVDGKTTMLEDPASVEGGADIDGIKLSLDKNENYLLFVNKKDSFLWKLELK